MKKQKIIRDASSVGVCSYFAACGNLEQKKSHSMI